MQRPYGFSSGDGLIGRCGSGERLIGKLDGDGIEIRILSGHSIEN